MNNGKPRNWQELTDQNAPFSHDAVRRWQSLMLSMKGGGWIERVSAEAAFSPDRWPEGAFFDLDEGAYYIPMG